MGAPSLDLSSRSRRRVLLTLSLINVAFAATTAVFIAVWQRLDTYSPAVQTFIKHVLVQGHLATENVVAAWYSSMLLLSVAAVALAAFAADRAGAPSRLSYGWLFVAAAFATLSFDEIGSLHERIGMVRALSPSADRAVGWVFVLAVPIAVVGLFLLSFAWLHVRSAPAAFRWMTAGVALFLSNPVFEAVEMKLIHGTGATPGTWPRLLHDGLLVLEEGVLELFGIVCFLAGGLAYLAFVSGGRIEWHVDARRARVAARALTVLCVTGVFAAVLLVDRLPPGDTGIPSNWFPAALFFTAALAAAVTSRPGLAALALACSAFCGAGLYGYSRLLLYGAPLVAAFASVIAGWMLEATVADSSAAGLRTAATHAPSGDSTPRSPARAASRSNSPGEK